MRAERDAVHPWHRDRRQRHEEVARPHPAQQAGGAAEDAEDQAAEREVDRDLRARCADGHADRDFTRLPDRAHDQQVREIDARDHQDETNRAEHDQQRRAHVTDDRVVQGCDHRREVAVRIRAAPAEIGREAAQFRARALDRRVRLQASHHTDASPRAARRGGVERGWHEEADRVARAVLGQGPESLRHHADHGVRLAVERERASEDRAIAAELRMPERVRQDDHASAAGVILVRAEHAAERGRGAEQREEIGGHLFAQDLHGFPGSREGAGHAGVAREALERLGEPVVFEVGRRDAKARRRRAARRRHLRQLHEPIGVRVGQRPEQHAIDNAEHGSVGADAERDRQDGHRGEAGRPPERAQGVSDLVDEHRLPLVRRRVCPFARGGTDFLSIESVRSRSL